MNIQLAEAVRHIPEADTFDLRKSWDFLRQSVSGHKFLIGLTSAITAGLMLLYIIVWPAVFSAEVLVLVVQCCLQFTRSRYYQAIDCGYAAG